MASKHVGINTHSDMIYCLAPVLTLLFSLQVPDCRCVLKAIWVGRCLTRQLGRLCSLQGPPAAADVSLAKTKEEEEEEEEEVEVGTPHLTPPGPCVCASVCVC